MMKSINVKQIRRKISFYFCLLFLILFYIRKINSLTMPSICLDEIGYWANAAYWSGKNWSGIMGNFSSYYSYGYSVILYLLMKFFKSPVLLHQAAIVANVVMVAYGYCVICNLTKRIYEQVNENVRNIVCCIPLVYPSIQFHTWIAWSETYLFMLFIISISAIIKVFESGKVISYFKFAIILFMLYITHLRSVGIVCIGILDLFIISILKRNKWREFIFFILTIIICMFGSSFIKHKIYENVYTDINIEQEVADEAYGKLDGNDYEGQIHKIKYMFSKEGFVNLLVSFFGKLYYFLLASVFTGGVGLWYLIQQVRFFIWNKEFNRTELFVDCYILGSYLGTLMISAIFMIYPARIDTVAYGRYTDCFGIIIIVFGIFKIILADYKESIKTILSAIIACLIYMKVFESYIVKYQIKDYFSSCAQIIACFIQLDRNNVLKVMTLVVTAAGITISLFLLVKYDYLKIIFIVMFLFTFWVRITEASVEAIVEIQYKDEICPVLEYLEESKEDQVYYLYDEKSNFKSNLYTGSIQYMLSDKRVQCISDITLIKVSNAVVITSQNYEIPFGYVTKCETGFYKVLEKEE